MHVTPLTSYTSTSAQELDINKEEFLSVFDFNVLKTFWCRDQETNRTIAYTFIIAE